MTRYLPPAWVTPDDDPHRLLVDGFTADQIVDRIHWHQDRIRYSEHHRDGVIDHAHHTHAQHREIHEAVIAGLLAATPTDRPKERPT